MITSRRVGRGGLPLRDRHRPSRHRRCGRGLRAAVAGIITDPAMLYIAIGNPGATVMPHNLYLHSSIVQTRRYPRDAEGPARGACASPSPIQILPSGHGLLHQCGDPDHRGGHLPSAGTDRCGGDPGCPSFAGAAAGRAHRGRRIRLGAAGRGPELFGHRHPGRPGGDGGIPRSPDAPSGCGG